MNTHLQMKTIGNLASLLLCTTLASCSLFESDPTKYVGPQDRRKTDDERSTVPAHFVVSSDEARLAIPFTKYNWSIYVDSQNFYLYPMISTPTHPGSAAVREYGYPLSGTTRHDIDRVQALRKKNRATRGAPVLSIRDLEQTLPRKHQTAP